MFYGDAMDAKTIIEALDLKPLPEEGGFFRENYRASGSISENQLQGKHRGDRSFSTAIYFLITPQDFSVLHKIPQDELFHFYLGDPVEMAQIDEEGRFRKIVLGPKILEGQHLQTAVPGGVWQGLHLVEGGQWALLGTTVAPGFDFRDFVKGERAALFAQFPEHRSEIFRFTRE